MTDTIDHKSGRPIDGELVAAGAGAATLITLAVQNKEALVAAGSAAVGVAVANPKLTASVAAVATIGYGIYRLTQSGTKIEFGKFKYERK
ncbi:hypothetical protein CSV86_009895 [Pseudomonas putida CSV86]|uniref:Uncharacterized protein n=1 Tax=Pseudomonas bharatica CSV86 TaxID=1005395 RepID=L1M426_9PSED|nr:hypothetical protein [Pseudomonas bharatica]NNJ15524.1 hypothetical protein [Pseudomonas bharatica CSV86]